MTTDVSQMVAAFRAKNPVETLGKTDKEVANMMLAQPGALTYAEAEALMKAFSGEPDPIGDIPAFSGKKASEADDSKFAKYMPQGDVPAPKDSKKGWLAAAIGGAVAIGAAFLTRGKGGKAVAAFEKAAAGNAGKVFKGVAGAAAGVTGAAALTSCSEDLTYAPDTDIDFNVTFDISDLTVRLDELIAQNSANTALFQKMLDYLEELSATQTDISNTIKTMLNDILAILNDMKTGDDERAVLLEKILNEIVSGKTENQQMLKDILDIIKSFKDEQSGFNNVVVALLNEMLTKLDSMDNTNRTHYDKILNAINELAMGNTESAEKFMDVLNEIWEAINSGNEISSSQRAILDAILTAITEMKNTAPEVAEKLSGLLNQILDAVNKNNNLTSEQTLLINAILEAVTGIQEGTPETVEKLTEFLQKILDEVNENNNFTSEQTVILNAILEAVTGIQEGTPETVEKLTEFLQKILDAVNENNNFTSEQTVILNGILEAVTSLQNSTPEAAEKLTAMLQKILDSVNNGTQVNVDGFNAVIEVLKSIKAADAEQAENIANLISAMWEDIAAGNQEIINALKELSTSGAANNKELMEFIQGLYDNSQISADERTDKIVDAINSVGQMVAKLEETVKTTGDAISNAIQDLGTKLDALLKAYQEGNATTQDVLSALRTIINALNKNNGLTSTTNEYLQELLNKADQIINGGGDFVDYTEILNQILDAINNVAAGIEDIKIGMGENNDDIVAALEQIINNQNVQTDALNEFAAASTANQQKLIEQGNTIIEKLEKISGDLGQGIATIIEKLKDSDAQLAAELAALTEALGLKMDDNAQDIVNAINGLEGNLTAIEDAIKNLIDVAGNDNLDLTTTNNLIQTVINLLSNQSDPAFDLSEVTSLLAANNDLLEQLLNKETGGSIDTGAIENALAEILDVIRNMNVGGGSGGVDLTTTNNLIQTCINQLSLLVQAQSTNADIMASVTNLGTQLTEVISNLQSGNVTTDEINAKLDEIMDAINQLSNSINS